MCPAHTGSTHCTLERDSCGCLVSVPAKGLEMKPVPWNLYSSRAEKSCREQCAGVRPPAARAAKQMGCRVLNQVQFLRSCLDNEHHSTQTYRS